LECAFHDLVINTSFAEVNSKKYNAGLALGRLKKGREVRVVWAMDFCGGVEA
jgi:hypothetical protein